MYSDAQKIKFMMDFTETHRACEHTDIYTREAKCLETQLGYSMLPLRDNDLIAGRKTELPIGFLPQTGFNSVGYYCDRPSITLLKKSADLTDGQYKDLKYLSDYWRGKTTNEKIYDAYSKEIKQELTHGDFNTERGPAFPFYRMSGAQMNPATLLENGINGLIANAQQKSGRNPAFFKGIVSALKALQALCVRYQNEALRLSQESTDSKRAAQLTAMAENLGIIAAEKPRTFWQAMQLSYLFYLVSGTFNYGRMDEYLGNFYVRDMDKGLISEDFALELVKNLWSLMIERDTRWDGRVILGGRDRRNCQEADRFAMLAMEASLQTRDILPQLTLRCYRGMNPAVYEKALAAIGKGCTYPILYNDDVNIDAVASAFALDKETAAQYVPFGCGEYVIYNKSFGTPSGAINLLNGLNDVIYARGRNLLSECHDFDSFYTAYMKEMARYILLLAQQEKIEYDICAEQAPFLYFSILFEDCMERGKAVFEGGIRYLGGTLECYGNTNTSDSLTAIKQFVYEQKKISPELLSQALQNDFKGNEYTLAQLLSAPKYGNDNDDADNMAVRFHNDLCNAVRDCAQKVGLHSYLAVIINNSMNTTFGLTTGASADGRRANSYMSNANNPVGGMDKNGITAMLNSLVKLSPDAHAGSVQNMRFSKEMFGRLLQKTKALLDTYFENGGTQMMITVLGRDDLEKAAAGPEKYQNLIVRVGGFSARFVELDRQVQLELMSRTLY